MFSYPALGIELSDGALKAVKLERRGTRLVVTWADYRPYARAEDGAVRPRAGLHPRADATLRAFLADAKPGPLDRVYVGFPSVATFNRLVSVPDVGEQRLQEIARYEAHRSLRGPIEDYVVRTHLLKRQPGQLEVPCQLYAVRRRLLDAFVSDLSEAGLEFDNLIPSPAALAAFVRYDRPAKGDRIVLSVGLRGTEVVYLRDRGFAFRTLPLGVIGLDAVGKGEPRVKAIRRLGERIASEVGKGATFFFGRDFQPESVSLFGEGASMPEVIWEFERHYPKIESIGSLHRLSIAGGVPPAAKPHVAQMGSALGLAIAAARADDPPIELLERNRTRTAARRLPGLAAASVFLSAVAYLSAERDVREAARIRRLHVSPTADEIRGLQEEHAAQLVELGRIAAHKADLDRFVESRRPRTPLLAAVVRRFGPSIRDFGDSDLRLVACRVQAADGGTEVTGRARAHILDAGAPTVLRQRLAAIRGVRTIEVSEVESERDEFAETTTLAFRVLVHEGGAG